MNKGSDLVGNLTELVSKMSLNIPKFDSHILVDTIPDFGGDPRELTSFVRRVRQVYERYYDERDEFCNQNEIIENVLRNKLYGDAKRLVDMMRAHKIEDILRTLITKFSDQRNESSLTFDLHNLIQGHNETVYDFYDRFEEIISIHSNYVDLHISNEEKRRDRCERFEEDAIVFIAHVQERYSSLLRNRGVKSLIEAIKIIREDDNIQHIQDQRKNMNHIKHKHNFSHNTKSNNPKRNFNYHNTYNSQNNYKTYTYPKNNHYQNNYDRNNFQRSQIQRFQHPKQNSNPQNYNSQNYNNPQNPNYQNHNPQNQNYQQPQTQNKNWTPMSGVSTIKSSFSNQNKPNYNKNRLYNVEHESFDRDYEQKDEIDNENFQSIADQRNQT